MENTHYTTTQLTTAAQGEWIRRDGSFRFPKTHPVIVAFVALLAGLLRGGGVKIDGNDYATGGKVSNRIRRMIDPAYAADATDDHGNPFGTTPPATVFVTPDMFHQFDIWQRGPGHVVTAEAMRPKMTQTVRRIIARLPEHGYRPGVAITVTDGMADTPDGVAVTAYRIV